MFTDAVRALADEAKRTNERRMIVITGESEADCVDLAIDMCATWGISDNNLSLVAEKSYHGRETVSFDDIDQLLGRTVPGLVYCAHQALDPNAFAAALGTISGGGVIVVCCPPFDTWAETPDSFTKSLIVPPYSTEDLTFLFRRRFIDSLTQFRGIAIVDADTDRVIDDGIINPAPTFPKQEDPPSVLACEPFSSDAMAACRTRDQQHALQALASLDRSESPVVLTADRGRGKSAALGIAAAEYARLGSAVVVTAPQTRNVQAVFAHALEILETNAEIAYSYDSEENTITIGEAGSIRFVPPEDVRKESIDVLFVDEAAGIGLPLLNQFLGVNRVAFSTTSHGYEGTGQRFAVTFQPHLEEVRSDVTEVRLSEPIRYAQTDPLEPWLFQTVLLNASAAPTDMVEDATLDSVDYEELRPDELSANESVLREVYGLLNYAHYKTEPSDLVRILDAPNLTVRGLTHNGSVVAVALLAEEGGLDKATREAMFEGERIRGNVIPDLLTSQLRDKSAAAPAGLRIVRIATHTDRHREGFGSRLLQYIRDEFKERVDWLGTSFSATAALVSFWDTNEFNAVHLSIRRNQTTGSHSVIMLQGLSEPGNELSNRHREWFALRLLGLITGAYRDIDPDVLITVIRSIDSTVKYELTARERKYLSGSIDGPGTYDHNPLAFQKLALNYFLTVDSSRLSEELERYIVVRILQGKSWSGDIEVGTFESAREFNQLIPRVVEELLSVLDET